MTYKNIAETLVGVTAFFATTTIMPGGLVWELFGATVVTAVVLFGIRQLVKE